MTGTLRKKRAPGPGAFLHLLRPFDFVLVLAGLLVTGAMATWAVSGTSGMATVRVESVDGVREYALDQDEELSLEGPLGLTVIGIKDSQVAFLDSPCRDKLCVHAGRLHGPGEWTACLPNRVFVSIVGQAAPAGDQPDVMTW